MRSAYFIRCQDFKFMETQVLYSDWNFYQDAQDKEGFLDH